MNSQAMLSASAGLSAGRLGVPSGKRSRARMATAPKAIAATSVRLGGMMNAVNVW